MALILRWFFIGSFRVESTVMEPTLSGQDLFIGLRLPFGWINPLSGTRWVAGRQPRLGELVLFDCGRGQLCLRRVVGVAGDRVEMHRQRLKINDVECHYDLTQKYPETMEFWEACGAHRWQIRWSTGKAMDLDWPLRIVPPKQVLLAGDWRSEVGAAPLLMPVDALRAAVWRIWISWSGGRGINTERIGLRPD
jgi:signal peptidase I